MSSEKFLSAFITLFGLVCAVIGCAHIILGPAAIPGAVPVNATMDSEDRFYATLFLGFGLACIWSARDLRGRSRVMLALMAVFFVGGIARLVSWMAVGPPGNLFIFLGAIELVLPIGVYLWWRAIRR